MSKTVNISGRLYDLYDISRLTDLSIEELALCSRSELTDIVLEALNGLNDPNGRHLAVGSFEFHDRTGGHRLEGCGYDHIFVTVPGCGAGDAGEILGFWDDFLALPDDRKEELGELAVMDGQVDLNELND